MQADMVPAPLLAMWGPHPGAENSALRMLCRSGSPHQRLTAVQIGIDLR